MNNVNAIGDAGMSMMYTSKRLHTYIYIYIFIYIFTTKKIMTKIKIYDFRLTHQYYNHINAS